MLDALLNIISTLTPVFVAVVTAYGAVLVAKVNRIQKDIKTNHGSKNLGDAIDTIRDKIEDVIDRQEDMSTTLESMQSRDESLSRRLYALERTKYRVLRQLGMKRTGPIETVKNKTIRKRKR